MGPRLVRTKSLTKEDPRGWGGLGENERRKKEEWFCYFSFIYHDSINDTSKILSVFRAHEIGGLGRGRGLHYRSGIFMRARPFSFCKGHFHWNISMSKGKLLKGHQGGNRRRGIHGLRLIQGLVLK